MGLDTNKALVPQCKVKIDGVELVKSMGYVESLSVNKTVSEMANSCDISFFCSYNQENSQMDGLFSKADVGKKIEVHLGYETPELVFIGFVNSTNVNFGSDGVQLSISCLDARAMLMGNNSRETFKDNTIKSVVDTLFDTVKQYVKDTKVSVATNSRDKKVPITQYEVDDYHFLCRLAKLTGSSFYMDGTTLKFVENVYKKAKLGKTYKWGKDLISFSRNVELSNQIGKVRVNGSDPVTKEMFFEEAVPISKPTEGKTGADSCSPVKKKVKEVTELSITTREEAKEYAEAIMRQCCLEMCRGRAQIIGDADLEPGSNIKFEGLDSTINGTYYVTGIQHTFGSNGFLTDISFCSPTD